MFTLNLGDKLVGRTRFCNYPPKALGISEVGGYLDLNYERIIALKPDLVLLLPEHEKAKQYFKELGINFLQVDNKTIQDILESINTIGKYCNASITANQLVETIKSSLSSVKKRTEKLDKPQVLISIGREWGVGSIKDLYIAGANTYFSELIEIAGGENVFKNKRIDYPTISAEGLIHLNPDIIIDFINTTVAKKISLQNILKDWESLPSLSAAKKNRISILDSSYISIPGPRFVLLLQDLAKSIHPEVNWNF